ncbi:MAG: hypothetical protein AAFR63_11230 [Cyanobacteria bacterium J06631_6]
MNNICCPAIILELLLIFVLNPFAGFTLLLLMLMVQALTGSVCPCCRHFLPLQKTISDRSNDISSSGDRS